MSNGNTWTAARVNEIYDLLQALVERPGFDIYQNGEETITTNTDVDVDITADAVTVFAANWTLSTTNDEIVCDSSADGYYLFGGEITWEAGSNTSEREVGIALNDSLIARQRVQNSGGSTIVSVVSRVTTIAATDNIQLVARHDDGSDLDLLRWRMWGIWLGKASA